jgi:undecaprenyl-diphosphatase
VDLLQAIILGVVQGLTEFLPISSSAHLRITASIAGWEDPGAAFTAVTQLGTESAVLIYFRQDLWRIARAWLRSLGNPREAVRADPDARMGWFIVAATIPIGVFGLAFEDQIEEGARNLTLIGTTLIVFALVLLFADRHGRHVRELHQLSLREGVTIGVAQALALVPGVSRSGATISAGLLLGLTRTAAARFSFLLAVPAVLASGLFQLFGILTGEEGGDEPFAYVAVATLVAFVCGYAVIAWLLRYLVTHTMTVFVVYRLALGALVLGLVAAGAIS